MARRVLTVRVAEAALRATGDRTDSTGENVVNVLLAWPRPGRAEVMGTTGLVRLTNHVRADQEPDRPPAFEVPVLKEVVEGDVALLVHVLDRDLEGRFARFLRAVGRAAVRDAAAAATGGGLVPGLWRHAFSEAATQGGLVVGGDPKQPERIEAIAVSRRPVLLRQEEIDALAATGEPRLEKVALAAPQDLARPREKGRLAPGRPNGHLVLELAVAGR